jgi:hypothetical protein
LGGPLTGRIYRAIIKDGIDGTTVFDADFTQVASGATSFSESSSNAATVTINQTAVAIPAYIGKGHPLVQGIAASRPAYTLGAGLTFDGTADFLKATAWTLNQPTTVYMIVQQVSWTDFDYLFDGNTVSSGAIRQSPATPSLQVIAGSGVATNTNLAIGAYGVVAAVFNGASSSLKVNNTAETTGNPGAGNMGGFTLGASGDTVSTFANIIVKEAAIFSTAHDATTRDRIIRYMAAKAGITV